MIRARSRAFGSHILLGLAIAACGDSADDVLGGMAGGSSTDTGGNGGMPLGAGAPSGGSGGATGGSTVVGGGGMGEGGEGGGGGEVGEIQCTFGFVCPANSKRCGIGDDAPCVTELSPQLGCATASCLPCPFPVNAQRACDANGECGVGLCFLGFDDCNGLPVDGCETNLTNDELNCGGCGTGCAADETCEDGLCVPDASPCAPPGTACGDVCADLLTSPNHCGGCDQPCNTGDDTTLYACVNGNCELGQFACPTGLTECNGSCVDLLADVAHCGGCGTVCETFGHLQVCNNGQCGPVCPTGFEHCSAEATCADTTRDLRHCGRCGSPCDTDEACSDGVCVPASSLVVFNGSGSITDFVIDDANAYFNTGSEILMVPLGGGAEVTIASGLVQARGLAADATNLYWGNYLGGAVVTIPKTGGSPQAIAAASQPTEVLVDDDYIFWRDASSTLWFAPKSGGAASEAYSSSPQVTRWAQNSSSLFALVPDGPGFFELVSSAKVAGVEDTFSSTSAGSELEASDEWVVTQADAESPFTDGQYLGVVHLSSNEWRLGRLEESTGPARVGLAIDGGNIYFAGTLAGTRVMQRTRLCDMPMMQSGSWPVTPMAYDEGPDPGQAVLTNATHVVWLGGGQIRRMLK